VSRPSGTLDTDADTCIDQPVCLDYLPQFEPVTAVYIGMQFLHKEAISRSDFFRRESRFDAEDRVRLTKLHGSLPD
jgi:hypothetical protein